LVVSFVIFLKNWRKAWTSNYSLTLWLLVSFKMLATSTSGLCQTSGLVQILISLQIINRAVQAICVLLHIEPLWRLLQLLPSMLRNTSAIFRTAPNYIRNVIDLSFGCRWFGHFRSISVDLTHLDNVPSTLSLHCICWIEWISGSFCFKFVDLWRVNILRVMLIVRNIGKSVLF